MDQRQTTSFGWFLMMIILFIFTLPDIIDGIFIYYRSALSRDIKGITSGLILMSVSSIMLVASVVYLYANSLSNAPLLKDSVAIIFLNDIDEQVYEIVSRLMPSWVERLEQEMKYYETNTDNHTNDEDRRLVHIESAVDASVTSRVEATANILGANENKRENRDNMSQDISVLFTHIENLNDQIRELHRIIEDLRQDVRRDIRIVKTQICL